jgi:DNA-binding transcriptional ArsR family regulator
LIVKYSTFHLYLQFMSFIYNREYSQIENRNYLRIVATSEMITMDPLEKIFGKTAQMTVLKNLIENQNESTYLSGIAQETGLSHSSVSRVITPLVGSGIVLEKPLGKQIRTFQLNMDSEATKLIIDFYNKINQIEA